MTDPRERILELALERMFEEDRGEAAQDSSADSADRVESILAAWKRGVTGTGLEALDLAQDEQQQGQVPFPSSATTSPAAAPAVPAVPVRTPPINGDRAQGPFEESPARPSTRPETGPRGLGVPTWLRAAAALLVLGVGFAFWVRSASAPDGSQPDADPRVAVVPTETAQTSGGTGQPGARELTSGERLVAADGAPTEFVWPGDLDGLAGRIVAAPGTVFEWHPALAGTAQAERLELHEGQLELAGAGALTLDVASAQVALAAHAALLARVELDAREPKESDPPVRLAFALRSGLATLRYAGLEQGLAQGESRELPGDAEVWWRETAEPVGRLAAELPAKSNLTRGFSPEGWLDRNLSFDSVAVKLAAMLERDPLAWEVLGVSFAMRPDPASEYEPRVPREQVDFLAWELSPRALELARTLWVESPQSFGEQHLVAFASLGSFEFERELRALLEGSSPELDTGVMAAAFYAARGDDVGRARLEHFARPRRWDTAFGSMAGWTTTLLACAALDWLGDPEPWQALLPELREEVARSLEGGFPTFAAFTLAFSDYFVIEGRGVLRRAPMDVGLALHYASLAPRAETPGQVRDLLEDIAGRW